MADSTLTILSERIESLDSDIDALKKRVLNLATSPTEDAVLVHVLALHKHLRSELLDAHTKLRELLLG